MRKLLSLGFGLELELGLGLAIRGKNVYTLAGAVRSPEH